MKSIMAKSLKYIVVCVFLILLCPVCALAQTIPDVSEEQVLEELKKRGLEEDEVREALLNNGLNPDELEDMSPSELIQVRGIIEELSEEKKKEERSKDRIKETERDTIPLDEEIEMEDTNPLDSLIRPEIDTMNLGHDSIPILIYGQELFRNSNLEVLEEKSNIKVPDSYVLGPGDEVAISAYGRSQFEEKFEVREDGYIRIIEEQVRVLLGGLTLGQAKEKLYKIYKKQYSFTRGEFQVSLNTSRTISIQIFGKVFNPGTYQVQAINSVINALMAANGPNNEGSLRKIELIRSSGKTQVDVYEIMSRPDKAKDFFLTDNDIIFVPDQGNIVTLTGAVTRSMKFELLEGEGIEDLLLYSGGFKANAYKKIIRVNRYEDDKYVVKDVPYTDLNKRNQDFELLNGDHVKVDAIETPAKNYVNVLGEVDNAGLYERKENMRLIDLVNLAGLKEESKTDRVQLTRINPDSTYQVIFLSLDMILADRNSVDNIVLKDRDELQIWPKSRFTDQKLFQVTGAVREEGEFSFDEDQSIRISDAIIMAGGLTRDAGEIVLVHRRDPLIPKSKAYETLDLNLIMSNPESEENLRINAFDDIEILSRNFFEEDATIRVSGAVNNAGVFQYGKNMVLEDAIALARGFKLAAATNNIEIARVIIKDNTPTQTVIANREMDRDFTSDKSKDKDFEIKPFDHIIVRWVPEFELQQNVIITGEVTYPGAYSLINDNETISNLIDRAGGLTREAFAAGSKLFRAGVEGADSGAIVMRLDEVMKSKNSRYNYILKHQDSISIPKQRDFVTIQGATRVREIVSDDIIGNSNSIKVAYHEGKTAKWYIDYYAGGLEEDTKKTLIFVEHPNGEVKHTERRFFLGFKYPEVQKGSVITVRRPPPKDIEDEEIKEDIDWTKVLSDSVAQAMSILTLILLIQRLD